MIRKKKRAGVDGVVPKITGAQVADLWRQATTRGPYPDVDACERIAALLTHHRQHGARDHLVAEENARTAEAARRILRTVEQRLAPIERVPPEPCLYGVADLNTFVELRQALERALPVLSPLSGKRWAAAPIWEMCGVLCWIVARNELKKLRRRSAGTSESSVAVRFAAFATQRMGFSGVTPAALAKRLSKAEENRTGGDCPG